VGFFALTYCGQKITHPTLGNYDSFLGKAPVPQGWRAPCPQEVKKYLPASGVTRERSGVARHLREAVKIFFTRKGRDKGAAVLPPCY
jgi:hypothetical protein